MSVREYDFYENLAMSDGLARETHIETIKALIDGCVSVVKTDLEVDKTGIDYIATLRGGATVGIDEKTRRQGASGWWKGEPELAVELWSVVEDDEHSPVVGWTLDESKATDYIFYWFDKRDSNRVYLIPFQLLRMAFRHNKPAWWRKYKHAQQGTDAPWGSWLSEAVFVPASVVMQAVTAEMQGVSA